MTRSHSSVAAAAVRLDADATGRRRRGRRVVVLLAAIFVLSMADLAATLANLHSTGMVEANPVARFVIERGDSWGLAAYKLATVGICIALLFRLRHHVQGEAASWVGLAILAGLSFYWGHYTTPMHSPEAISVNMNATLDDRWLSLGE